MTISNVLSVTVTVSVNWNITNATMEKVNGSWMMEDCQSSAVTGRQHLNVVMSL